MTTDDTKYILFVGVPEAPEGEEPQWNQWYDEVHIPHRLQVPGFLGAHRFESVFGQFRYLTYYEISSPDVLASEEYQQLRAAEEQLGADSFETKTVKTPGIVRGVYQSIAATQRPPEQCLDDLSTVSTLFAMGQDVPPGKEEEFHVWYETEHLPAMLDQVPGFLRAQRFVLVDPDQFPAAAGATSARYSTLYALSDLDVLDSAEFEQWRNSPWSSWIRSWYFRKMRVLAERV